MSSLQSAGCKFWCGRQVLAEARRLNFLSVRGNHDDKALAAYEAFKRGRRVPTKRSFVEDMPEAAARWLHALPFSISLPSYGIVVVHAGIVPDVSPLPHTFTPYSTTYDRGYLPSKTF